MFTKFSQKKRSYILLFTMCLALPFKTTEASASRCASDFTPSLDMNWRTANLESWPAYAREADLRFVGSKMKELNATINTRFEDETTTFVESFAKDLAGGNEKIEILRRLGFKLQSTDQTMLEATPDWITFSMSYRKELERRGIPIHKTLRPALVLVKNFESSERKYLLVDPITEKLPPDGSGWRVLTAKEEFNIPAAMVLAAVRRGKWPLMDAVHDTSHFIANLRFPKVVEKFIEAAKLRGAGGTSRGFDLRSFWVFESLSLPDTSLCGNFDQLHRSWFSLDRSASSKEILSRLEVLSNIQLGEYLQAYSKVFISTLADFSGSQSSSSEKIEMRSGVFWGSVRAQNWRLAPLKGLLRVKDTINGLRQPLAVLSEQRGSDVITFNLDTAAVYLRSLGQFIAMPDSEVLDHIKKLNPEVQGQYNLSNESNSVQNLKLNLATESFRVLSALQDFVVAAQKGLSPERGVDDLLIQRRPLETWTGRLLTRLFPSQYFKEQFIAPPN